MKTKNIIAIMAALPIMAGLGGCKSDDELTAKPAKEILRVEGGSVELRAGQKTADVKVYADCAWQVLDTDGGDFGDKLSVAPKAGDGNGTLVISVDENTGIVERRDTIILKSAGGLMQKIPIRQVSGDPAMNISQDAFHFGADGSELKPLVISSNDNWTLQIPPGAWFHVQDANGNDVTSGKAGTTTVFVSADPSGTDADRMSLFTLSYSGKSAQVEVSQTGLADIYLNAPEQLERFQTDGGEQMLFVESNAAWNAFIPSSASEWLHIEPAYGMGNGEIRVTCTPNNTTTERVAAVVLIAGSRNPRQQVVFIEQLGNSSSQPLETSISLYQINVLRQSARFVFTIVSDEVVGDYGLVYSSAVTSPVMGDNNVESLQVGRGGTSQGVNAELTGLHENTTYYVRAYVTKPSTGETVYSNAVAITTLASQTSVGELTSLYVGNTSASFRYSFVADEEVEEYGLVYSPTAENPTIENAERYAVGRGGTAQSVLAELSGLQEGTTYYVRAFVRSSSLGTAYSPNRVAITTSKSPREPGESDNPDPQLAPSR